MLLPPKNNSRARWNRTGLTGLNLQAMVIGTIDGFEVISGRYNTPYSLQLQIQCTRFPQLLHMTLQ